MPQPPPELFAERPVRSDFARRGPSYATRRIITLAVLAIIIGGSSYAAFAHFHPSGPAQIPVIKAEGSYKQKPQTPGGIDIPHQDVEVYRELDGSAASKSDVEHLMPPPEVPLIPTSTGPTSAALAPPIVQGSESLLPPEAPTEKIETTVLLSAKPIVPAAAPTAPVLETQLPTPASVPNMPASLPPTAVTPPDESNFTTITSKGATVSPLKPTALQGAPAVDPSPSPMAGVLSRTAAPSPSGQAAKGSTHIQLASVQDEGAAEQVMQKLQSRYASVLGETKLHLTKADLGSRGIYFRIQSQGLPDQQAVRLCSELKSMNTGCILVRQ